jgi:hypothetical protein
MWVRRAHKVTRVHKGRKDRKAMLVRKEKSGRKALKGT